MYRAARNRRQVITSNKAGKTELPRNDKTGLTSPVFYFAGSESVSVVGKSWSKSRPKVTSTAGNCWHAILETPVRKALPPIEQPLVRHAPCTSLRASVATKVLRNALNGISKEAGMKHISKKILVSALVLGLSGGAGSVYAQAGGGGGAGGGSGGGSAGGGSAGGAGVGGGGGMGGANAGGSNGAGMSSAPGGNAVGGGMGTGTGATPNMKSNGSSANSNSTTSPNGSGTMSKPQ
jgi:hypothetical protein